MSVSRGRILLTGATGFLGPYMSAVLAADGWVIRSALRSAKSDVSGESIVVGSIGPATDWSAALKGVDAVVHLAARAHRSISIQSAEREIYFAINTEGTANLALQAEACGVKKFVFMSSIAINGSNTDNRVPFRETDAPSPRTVYAESKAAAEDALCSLSYRSGFAVTVVRPPMIYGRRAKGSFESLKRAVIRGVPLPFAMVCNRRAFVAAENVASFVKWDLATGRGGFERFIVADNEHVSTAGFIRAVARALNRPVRLWSVSPPVLRRAMLLMRYPDLVDSTLRSLEVDTSKACAAGWRAPVAMNAGLSEALAEFKDAAY